MSLSESVYLGPFFECRNRPSGERATAHGCVNEHCRDYHQPIYSRVNSFCAGCGQPRGEWETDEVLWELDWSDVSEAVKEQLTLAGRDDDDASVMRWIPNVVRKGDPTSDRPTGDRGDTVVITDFDPRSERAWLWSAFAEERQILEGIYGIDNMTIQWGLIRWWS